MGKMFTPATPPPLTQWAFTSKFEGVIPHLYLDKRRNVTCGVGFLVSTIAELDRYPWRPSVATARGDWHELQKASVLAAQAPGYYRRICCARLGAEDMRQLFEAKVATFRSAIAEHWRLYQQPEAVQIALVDMAFQVGARGLHKTKWPNLHAAVLAGRWEEAAKESFRPDAQRARNARTAELFLSAALSLH
jgi:GH24 family phage-related lysozyme (muramidase)